MNERAIFFSNVNFLSFDNNQTQKKKSLKKNFEKTFRS